MKSIFLVILAFGTFSIFRSFGSSNKGLEQLQFFKIGLAKSELEKKFGRPVYQKKSLEEYLLSDQSVLRVIVDPKKNAIESATLEFHKPVEISELNQGSEKVFTLYENEKINTTTPTYFYAALKDKGMLWKVLINGKVSSVSWINPESQTKVKTESKTLEQLLTAFRHDKK
jgi:hypothetical protein